MTIFSCLVVCTVLFYDTCFIFLHQNQLFLIVRVIVSVLSLMPVVKMNWVF